MKPAIITVGYNREDALKRLLESVNRAWFPSQDIPLIISLDKAKEDHGVMELAKEFSWEHGEKIIRTFETRQGLRKHILSCGDLTNEYGAVIVLEDDLVVSPGFYQYVTDALDYYQDREDIAGIALYSHEWNGYAGRFFQPIADSYDTYLGQFGISWGQCWTKKSWNKFKEWYNRREGNLGFNEQIPASINLWSEQSWGKYFNNYITEENKYYVIPRISLSTNCSEVGQHAREFNNDHQVRLLHTHNFKYRFAPMEEACRYDIFFENQNLKSFLPDEIQAAGVDIDLNGTGRNTKGSRYLLSTLELPYQVISSFGIKLRPMDMNVIYHVPGEGIFLYDKEQKADAPAYDSQSDVIRYELRGMSNKMLLRYLMRIMKTRIKARVKK